MQRHLSNFGTESSEEHFCEIILKSAYQPWWRCRFTGFSIFSSGGHYVEQGRSILSILEKLHQGNFAYNYFEIDPLALELMLFKAFFYF